MRRDHILVFDEHMKAGQSAWTSSRFDEVIGRYDQLAMFLTLDRISIASATINVQILHSGDGENFVVKAASGTPEVTLTWASTPGTTLSAWGSDPNTGTNPQTPFLQFVRLVINLGGATGLARVRLYATQRDQGG